jgi:branched-chain amino acid transport system permease protein
LLRVEQYFTPARIEVRFALTNAAHRATSHRRPNGRARAVNVVRNFWLPQPVLISAAAIVAATAALALAIAFPFGPLGAQIVTLTLVQLAAIVALAIFTGNTGIVSFGHAALMGVGAYVAGILTMTPALQRIALPQLPGWMAGWHLALTPSLLLVAAVGLLVGLLTGLPISRLAGEAAAIATFAILIIVNSLLIGARSITRGSQTFYGVPRLTTLWTALACACGLILFARCYRDSRYGLLARAARDNDVAAAAIGIDTRHTRYLAWSASCAGAALAGALYGNFLGAFSPKDFYFDLSFGLVAMLIVGGMYTITGALAGTVLLTAVVEALRHVESGLDLGFVSLPAIYGLPAVGLSVAVLLTIWRRPQGLVGLNEWISRTLTVAAPHSIGSAPRTPSEPTTLGIDRLSVRYGGITALDEVSINVRTREVIGLIGPNGAGKTTLINAICGQIQPSSGAVHIGTSRIDGAGSVAIARSGLARTFQNIRLFDRLSVFDNVVVAALHGGIGLKAAREHAAAQIARFGLQQVQQRLAGTLPYGSRRRLEIARALALNPRFLLLDEPAAGMNPTETEALFLILNAVRREYELGLLVIEHDLHFIMRLCDRIVVLNKGQKIAEGTPGEVRLNPAVIEAYIGTKRSRSLSDPVLE